ncbi:hypothetical protein HN695_06175 [Candidatus Woesearchaeota archaeon]|nr:hypothetical protein [Candidatus Woesearchaeota archaeon]MBT5272705.1 hypothetical protein [Candidatus Woesearchaeota archaeon]MBT6040316.1 hypothetical protein [Candidatus Woesearchaeota archaeon]MBT6337050.1 hypothetical protein [Candidatus Woesearchaeota archaeon]MBT7927896.1 hypothetical protein [Candidatus Woesearchaeota archaeon]
MECKKLIKKWWFWLVVIYFIIGLYVAISGGFFVPEPNTIQKIMFFFIWPIIFF